MLFTKFIQALSKANNAALVVGAGISIDAGISSGYGIPMAFGDAYPDILCSLDLYDIWKVAKESKTDKRWLFEEFYTKLLVDEFYKSCELQRIFVDWLSENNDYKMAGIKSDIHAAFSIAWLNRIFTHLVTTNWDFLLEYHIEDIYEGEYYGANWNPFEPVKYQFNSGQIATISPDRLFFSQKLDDDDFFMHPRWDIIANHSDLENLQRWTRPIWKIHGSPFFLACPKCGGFSHWKWLEKVSIGDHCPEHPDQILQPEIIFWGKGINTVDPIVWKRLKGRLSRSDMIVVCGLSGYGSDEYLRLAIEENVNTWVINPNIGAWNPEKIKHISATAGDLADILIEHFIV